MSEPKTHAPLVRAATAEALPDAVRGTLQRTCACGTHAPGGACPRCSRAAGGAAKPSSLLEGLPLPVQEALSAPGLPLESGLRSALEPALGGDLSGVRIHADAAGAASTRSVNARAYTLGQHIVFGPGTFEPHTPKGRRLLVHELAHTLQQSPRATRMEGILPAHHPLEAEADRAARQVLSGGRAHVSRGSLGLALQRDQGATNACDDAHAKEVQTAKETASGWLRGVDTWFTTHLDRIKKQARRGDEYKRVGSVLFSELSLLDKHFKYRDVVTKEWHGRFPDSENWEGTFKEFETLGRASYTIRKTFMDVHVSDLESQCVAACPKGKKGSEVLGSAMPGSKVFTVYTSCFDAQDPKTKAGVVLHEAFHASFSSFDTDSYSFESDYPSDHALTNAESYATFAAFAATGSGYRITLLPEMNITASPGP